MQLLTPRLGYLSVGSRGGGRGTASDDTGYVGDGEGGWGLSRGRGGEAQGSRGGGTLRHLAAGRVLRIDHKCAAGRHWVVNLAPAKRTRAYYSITCKVNICLTYLQREHVYLTHVKWKMSMLHLQKKHVYITSVKWKISTLHLQREHVHIISTKRTGTHSANRKIIHLALAKGTRIYCICKGNSRKPLHRIN